jgi:membrane protein
LKTLKTYLKVLKDAWTIFAANFPIEFASSFAYFSLFGLPSILLINIFLLSIFFESSLLYYNVGQQLEVIVGEESADLLVIITQNYFEQASQNLLSGIGYVITIFLLATQLLVFFQDMLNDMWLIKPDFKNFWQKQLKERGITFIMVLLTGLLFFTSVVFEKLTETFLGETGEGVQDALINILTSVVVYFWFVILYKFLPFAYLPWKPALVGGALTTLLFLAGFVLLLEFEVKERSLEDIYDYVAPIVRVSFWIFYNALAFLFGASFTKAYADFKGDKIQTKSYAYRYKMVKDE